MHGHRNMISIWFFIGVLLLIYGIAILFSGLAELRTPSTRTTVLAELHAPIWWGALLTVIGLLYSLRFSPWRKK
jgi:hypothetical protein